MGRAVFTGWSGNVQSFFNLIAKYFRPRAAGRDAGMHQSKFLKVGLFIVSVLFVHGSVDTVVAQTQSKSQQKCILQINKSARRVATTKAKDIGRCLKDASRGTLAYPSVDDCVLAVSTKLTKAKTKTTGAEAKSCGTAPDFGFVGATSANAWAENEQIGVIAGLLGGDLGAATATGQGDSRCQQGVQRANQKLVATQLKIFEKCKKIGLKNQTIISAATLQDCMDNIVTDTRKIPKAKAKITKTITQRCPGFDLDEVFPGQCVGVPVGEFVDCVAEVSTCFTCRNLNGVDALGDDCDAIDDGIPGNDSCPPMCNDAVQGGDETDIDCGGSCPACEPGQGCALASDCTSGVCISAAPPWVCAVPNCSDGVANGDETDVDCGGPTCSTGCPAGDNCNVASDCDSGVCTGNECQAPTCSDGVQNGTESDIDCGGPSCAGCPPGDTCNTASDCDSGVCTGGICQTPTCTDNVENGSETDIDCGGSCPDDCEINEGCNTGADCKTTVCSGGLCKCSSGASIFNFGIGSNSGGTTDSAEWPNGSQNQALANWAGCNVSIRNPSGNIDLVGNLGDDFGVTGFAGFASCSGNGGEDGDGCSSGGCPFAGIGSCESNRPSCSVALNGSASASFRVQCNP